VHLDSDVLAAQYLRMSTEHQQYSLQNQSAAILKYAASHGFSLVRSYCDAAKSGLVLSRRPGLRQLLKDVVGGTANFKVILVYDVSRWGRFQDTDEAAHYEFLCKSAGVPVHYCAESFSNDGTLPSLIMKALKRTMAGEYSRELGVKVLAGQKRLALLGFKQGGMPGYGLRRMLISSDGRPKQELAANERKSIATDRVILVPGPPREVRLVPSIFRMLVSERMTVHGVACELNRKGVKYIGNSKWDYQAVHAILTHPKYTGTNVHGRTSSRLYTPTVKLPRSEWTIAPGAFEPIVSTQTFEKAQFILDQRTIKQSDAVLLDRLKRLWMKEGRLSLELIKTSLSVPSPSTYRGRFGSLRRAYELIGYGKPDQFGPIDLRRRTQALREDLLSSIQRASPNEVAVLRRGGRWRAFLKLKDGAIVSVMVARSVRVWKSTIQWQIDPVPRECGNVTLLARLDEENRDFLDFHVLPNIDRKKRFQIRRRDAYLDRGLPLASLASFCDVVVKVCPAHCITRLETSGASNSLCRARQG